MIRKALGIFAVSLLFLAGCGGQNAGPHNINGMWEISNGLWEHHPHLSRRVEINGNQFVMTIYNRSHSQQSINENEPGFDEIEVGEIDFDTYFLLTGENVNPDVYKVEITNVMESSTIVDRIPTQVINIEFQMLDANDRHVFHRYPHYIRLYENEPGFALAQNIEFTWGEDIDFHTHYLLTGIKVNEAYVNRIMVFGPHLTQGNRNIREYSKQFSFAYFSTAQRYGTFTLMDDGRKEVIWGDTGDVQLFHFDRTPNTIHFAGWRYQRAD